jgi:hypothetical protein
MYNSYIYRKDDVRSPFVKPPWISGASGVKNWHPPIGQTGRKGVSRREAERTSERG